MQDVQMLESSLAPAALGIRVTAKHGDKGSHGAGHLSVGQCGLVVGRVGGAHACLPEKLLPLSLH